MTAYGAELILTDFIVAVERFVDQMKLQRTSVAAVASHQREAEESLAQARQELNSLHHAVGAKRRELEGLFAEIKRLTGKLSEERQARGVA